MENFDLIDDYVRGRLEGQEKEAFEKQLQADPSLQGEVTLQQQLIEGIKKARISELKTMLSQVPVTGAMTVGAGLSAGQIATGVIASAVVATSTLFYFKPWKSNDAPPVKIEQPAIEPVAPKTEPTEVKAPETKTEESKTVAAEPKKKMVKKVVPSTTKEVRPNIQVIDPTDELSTTSSVDAAKAKDQKDIGAISTSQIEVETIDSNKEYSFHYQFNQGKLTLYGKFDKGLYEIIEVNGTTHSVFLFYKDNYFLLNEKETSITPLIPIRDGQLIKKLKDYRKG
jgi:hypothetical protein